MKIRSQITERLIRISAFLSALLLIISVCGCSHQPSDSQAGKSEEFIRSTNFLLNTVVTITIYDSEDEALLTGCMDLCKKYENIFSRTSAASELYQLNHRALPQDEGTSNTYTVSQELADLLSIGLDYSRKSNGVFDIAIAPLTELWDFSSESPKVPDDAAIHEALTKCGLQGVSVNGQKVTLESPETAFDLGGIAKGYIADRIKDYLLSQGVKSATISLGGNIVCIGSKPDGTPFKIGIQKPFADRNETAAAVEIEDKSVVSSGIYERFFEEDGILYHHILNPADGYPYQNDLIAVTIISDKSVDGDALSTTCFALGYEKGLEYIQTLPDVQAIFITEDYKLHYTSDFTQYVRLVNTE